MLDYIFRDTELSGHESPQYLRELADLKKDQAEVEKEVGKAAMAAGAGMLGVGNLGGVAVMGGGAIFIVKGNDTQAEALKLEQQAKEEEARRAAEEAKRAAEEAKRAAEEEAAKQEQERIRQQKEQIEHDVERGMHDHNESLKPERDRERDLEGNPREGYRDQVFPDGRDFSNTG